MHQFDDLLNSLDPKHTKLNEPLSKHTTLNIGGPAEVWYEPRTTEALIVALRKANELGIPTTMLGWGSNVLVSDNGIRGLVIKNLSQQIEIIKKEEEGEKKAEQKPYTPPPHLEQPGAEEYGRYIGRFDELDYDESEHPQVFVKLDSGVALPIAISHLISQSITGLQWYSRIPGTIGGAIANNTHGGTHFISEVIDSVRVITQTGEHKELLHHELGIGYDRTRFHDSGEVIIDATLKLYRGDTERARRVVAEWARRKNIQPQNSAGCVFANISHEDMKRIHAPTTATGWIIEHILHMTGYRVGDIMISPKHHNFIENIGHGTAGDYLKVIKTIIQSTREKIGLTLRPEIFFLGFSDKKLSGVTQTKKP